MQSREFQGTAQPHACHSMNRLPASAWCLSGRGLDVFHMEAAATVPL
jgi:hypothetical protein